MKPQKAVSSGLQLNVSDLVISCPQSGRANRLTSGRLGNQFRCGDCRMSSPASAEPVDLADSHVFRSLATSSALPVLVASTALRCRPCKVVAPDLLKVAKRSAVQGLVVKVDTEALPEVTARFGIQSIPAIAVFESGREVRRQGGATPAPDILRFMHRAS